MRIPVEFVKYDEILPGFREQGLLEAIDDDDCLRLEMESLDRFGIVHLNDPVSTVPPFPGAVTIQSTIAELPDLLRQILDKTHLDEVLLVPNGQWCDIFDTVAYALASNELWLSIDAIAAMHQNTHNPLSVARSETLILVDLVQAIFDNASSPKQELMLTSDVVPFLVEILYDGAISITCEKPLAEELTQMLQSD